VYTGLDTSVDSGVPRRANLRFPLINHTLSFLVKKKRQPAAWLPVEILMTVNLDVISASCTKSAVTSNQPKGCKMSYRQSNHLQSIWKLLCKQAHLLGNTSYRVPRHKKTFPPQTRYAGFWSAHHCTAVQADGLHDAEVSAVMTPHDR
jgi:hypothetical protein